MLPVLPLIGALPLLAAPPPAEIAVYTMGPGQHVFERFGHAAICVEHPVNAGRAPADRCYNYGTTDFQTPPQQIGWDFVRGKAKFWVSVWPRERMLQAYIAADRDVYRQVLVLSPSEQAQLERRLVHDSQEANRYYRYHHFDDNCTTRIRDVVDEAVAGRLLSHGKTDVGVTRRELGAAGLAEWPLAVALGQLFAGPRLDEPLHLKQAMFLPSYLRQELETRLGAQAEVVHRRRGPAFKQQAPSTWPLFVVASGLLMLPAAVAVASKRRVRLAAAAVGLLLGVVGCAVWALSLSAEMNELRVNQALLLFWPSDLALGLLAPDARRVYSRLRAIGAVLVLALLGVGVLAQPLGLPTLLVLLPHAWFALERRDVGPRAPA